MAKILERERAKCLRKKGESIGEIAKKLKVSKGTVSYWCKDIALSSTQIEHLTRQQKRAGLKTILMIAEKRRKKRMLDVKQFNNLGRKDVGKTSGRDLFMIGLALYWGEGYKKGSEECGFTNSDPFIIKIIIKWLKDIYGVETDNLTLRVSINHIHKKRVPKVLKYWSQITGVSLGQFTKTSLIKTDSKKRYPNHDEHFGTLRIKVQKGTNLRRRILGSISKIGDIVN